MSFNRYTDEYVRVMSGINLPQGEQEHIIERCLASTAKRVFPTKTIIAVTALSGTAAAAAFGIYKYRKSRA